MNEKQQMLNEGPLIISLSKQKQKKAAKRIPLTVNV